MLKLIIVLEVIFLAEVKIIFTDIRLCQTVKNEKIKWKCICKNVSFSRSAKFPEKWILRCSTWPVSRRARSTCSAWPPSTTKANQNPWQPTRPSRLKIRSVIPQIWFISRNLNLISKSLFLYSYLFLQLHARSQGSIEHFREIFRLANIFAIRYTFSLSHLVFAWLNNRSMIFCVLRILHRHRWNDAFEVCFIFLASKNILPCLP